MGILVTGSGSSGRQETERKKHKEGRKKFTIGLVLKGRGNMQPDKASGAEDIVVTEMLKELPTEST